MGSTVDTVVSSGPPAFPTNSPNWALAMPAMPLMGEVILVKLRSIWVFCSAALAACTAARAEASRPMASSRSFLLTALTAAKGLIFSKLALAVYNCPSATASCPLACSRAAWKGRGSISKRTWPFLTKEPSL